ncbi:hypothetical protein EJ08DRAFT_141850 [Tothia fuscella]|uniref:Uncharacterized protein n=1 Tax=Tothia fuscella TaxID=1048955 RepID=A0A9P4U0V8_9PEZI|nr:hypothetical protein EJ08DRAFT_141850 [Tothia fuscella]
MSSMISQSESKSVDSMPAAHTNDSESVFGPNGFSNLDSVPSDTTPLDIASPTQPTLPSIMTTIAKSPNAIALETPSKAESDIEAMVSTSTSPIHLSAWRPWARSKPRHRGVGFLDLPRELRDKIYTEGLVIPNHFARKVSCQRAMNGLNHTRATRSSLDGSNLTQHLHLDSFAHAARSTKKQLRSCSIRMISIYRGI